MKNPDMFQPYIFQDNLFKAPEAQIENVKMVEMVEEKLLSFNYDKCCAVVLGNGKARRKLLKDLEENPLTLSGHKLKV